MAAPSSSNDRLAAMVAIFTAFFALVGTCFTAFLGFKMAELSNRTNIVSEQNIAVSKKVTDIATETAIVKHTTLQTKDYVNHLMELQLALNARTTKRLAELTNSDVDKEIATKATKDYEDHLAEKAKVDEKDKQTRIIVPGVIVPGVVVPEGAVPGAAVPNVALPGAESK